MKLSEGVIKFLGTDEPSDEVLDTKITQMLASNESLQTDKESLGTEVNTLKASNAELAKREDLAKVGDGYLKDLRTKAEASYKLLRGENAKEDMVKVIQSAGVEQLRAMVIEYDAELEDKMPGTCSECGKVAKLIRRSSKEVAEEKKEAASASDYISGE